MRAPVLYHFSENASIRQFDPRPVAVPWPREAGMDWLNEPLVWAVNELKQATYLFPRDCPRILLWPTKDTTLEDRERWWGERECRMIAHVEWNWLERIRQTTLYRYELPGESFHPIEDGWMCVSTTAVEPTGVLVIEDLLAALEDEHVELRVMENLLPLRDIWSTTLHASGIRLRNAISWESGS